MSIPYRKKLIEVALPLAKINEAAPREKSIRHGHPSTLHLWWARRPLAACRAVLFASLVDDPDSDPEFSFDENVAASKRAKLFNLIEELVLWENSNNPRVINAARAEIARCLVSRKIETGELKKDQILRSRIRKNSGEAPENLASGQILRSLIRKNSGETSSDKAPNPNSCEFGYEEVESTYTPFEIKGMLAKPEDVNAFLAEHAPPVLDPFCGGGSIPLEAQRLGLRAYASDLNAVPVLITKALIEIPPKFAGRPPVNPDWQAKSKEKRPPPSGTAPRVSPRTCAITANGCATRPRNASGISIPR
jgi:putative DNA methylase